VQPHSYSLSWCQCWCWCILYASPRSREGDESFFDVPNLFILFYYFTKKQNMVLCNLTLILCPGARAAGGAAAYDCAGSVAAAFDGIGAGGGVGAASGQPRLSL
jgi:hypothetical protein